MADPKFGEELKNFRIAPKVLRQKSTLTGY
jgi:hypothetical protein